MIIEIKSSPIPNYGDHMTILEFIEAVESGGFIDYDGFGKYASETEMSEIVVRPSDIKNGRLVRGFSHVVWFNR